MRPAGSTSRERQNFAPCVDARFGARRIFWIGAARGRVLTCVRPLMRLTRRRPGWEMLWGERRGTGIIVARQNDGVPHAPVQRPEPIPHGPHAGQHPDRCSRDEPISLARRWAPSRDRATPAQKIEPDEATLL